MSIRKRIIKILLVGYDSVDQMELRRTLDRRNILYKFTIARNETEVVQMLSENINGLYPNLPDFILVDLSTPHMNCFELVSYIKANVAWKDVRVYAIGNRSEDKIPVQTLGIAGFITKPLKFDNSSSMDAFNLMMDLMNT